MATVRGTSDPAVVALKFALEDYEGEHGGAEATLYRQNSGAIRVRVVDQAFAGMKRSQRHDDVWDYLSKKVDPDVLQEISVLLLMPPDELGSSIMNLEFEDPLPSTL